MFTNLEPLVRGSKKGLPATGQVLDKTRPLLARLDPLLRNLTPIIDYLGLYRHEIAAFFANDAAATQATEGGFNDPSKFIHYLRTTNPVNPEMMTGWPYRLSTNRSNPYTEPGGYNKLGTEGHSRCSAIPLHANPPCRRRPPRTLLPQTCSTRSRSSSSAAPTNRARRPALRPAGAARAALVGQPGRYPHVAAAAVEAAAVPKLTP